MQRGFSNSFIIMIADSRLATIAPAFIYNLGLTFFKQKPLTVNLRVIQKQKVFYDKYGSAVNEDIILNQMQWQIDTGEMMESVDAFNGLQS